MTAFLPEIHRLGRWAGGLLAVVSVVGLFGDLAGLTIRLDEARLAVNALEMVRTGNWLVTTYDYVPDLWNTKPPLMVWVQAVFIKLLGPTEWAIRLPAALAALATVLLLFQFITRFLQRPVSSLLAGSALLGSLGFLGEHHGRTGDYDALLTLAGLGTGLSLLLVMETNNQRWWLGVGVGMVVATLTKGIAALLPLPAVGLYCLLHSRGRQLLRQPGLWLVGLVWLLVVSGWYLLRESAVPGYWQAVNMNELGGRFGTTLENHKQPWYFYFHVMARNKFLPWIYLLPLVIPFALRHPVARVRRVAWFALIWASGLFLIISSAQTRIEWYALPAYPWLALLVGLGAPRLAAYILSKVPTGVGHIVLRILLVAFIIVPPLVNIRNELRNNWRDSAALDERPGYGLRALQHEASPPAPLFVVATPGFDQATRPLDAGGSLGYNPSLRFYVLAYPCPIQVIDASFVVALQPPGYVLTAKPVDSLTVRRAFPQAIPQAVGRYPCWLWKLPASP